MGYLTVEKDHSSWNRLDLGDRFVAVDQQFAAIPLIPAFGQVENDGEPSLVVIYEPIDVLFVKGSCFVKSILKFMGSYARITGSVQVLDKFIDFLEESFLTFIGQ